MKRLYTVLMFLFIGGFIFAEEVSLALIEFELRGNLSIDPVVVTESLQTELVNDKHITVVERSKLDKVMEEHELEMSGLIDSDRAAEIGEFLGASKILFGTISHTGEYFVITVKAVDVESGVVDFADQVMSWDKQGVFDVIPTLSDRISRLARDKKVKDYKLKEKDKPSNGKNGNKNTAKTFQFIKNSALGINYLVGAAPELSNCALTGFEISFRIPTHTLIQFDFDTGFLWGDATDTSRLSVYRIHPNLYIRLLDRKWFHLGMKTGFAAQWCNVKPKNSGFINRYYPFIQYDVTLGVESTLVIAKKLALRLGYEFGLPIRYWVNTDNAVNDASLSDSLGITALEENKGFMHHLLYLSVDWQF